MNIPKHMDSRSRAIK